MTKLKKLARWQWFILIWCLSLAGSFIVLQVIKFTLNLMLSPSPA